MKEKDKPISKRLKKYLHEHHDAVPIIKDIDSLTEEQLENLLESHNPEGNHFSIHPPEDFEDGKWRVWYGFDHMTDYSEKAYNTYSEALENGAIEFIDSFCNDRDEEGNLYLYID